MTALYFICPFVFLLLGLIIPPLMRPDLPEQVKITVGVLDTQDIRKMTQQQLNALRSVLRRYLFLAFAAALMIAVAFALLLIPAEASSILLCNALELAMGMGLLRLVLKKALAFKRELQNTPPEG